jgi:hypothetical protein
MQAADEVGHSPNFQTKRQQDSGSQFCEFRFKQHVLDTDYKGLRFRVLGQDRITHMKKFSKGCRQQMKVVGALIFRQRRDRNILGHKVFRV